MQLFSLVALLPLLSNVALAAPSNTDGPVTTLTSSTFVGVAPIDAAYRVTNGTDVNRASSCYSTKLNINRADLTALSSDLQNNNPWALTYVPSGQRIGWYLGSALVCIYNDYIFENTHVTRWEAGWAIKYIQDTCFYTGSGVWYGCFFLFPRWGDDLSWGFWACTSSSAAQKPARDVLSGIEGTSMRIGNMTLRT
ncbi:hypothetical protein CVT24_000948 [Panaeolus cyanescens]|uniref:Ecp2 effector protein domain-containing protein n=1 Tax=Panaeolus cyanescens TaxID=181874 RepID=A0A409YCL0_9AGAR|nr:hypothetical protein CVT24_000948 [Panaeolus cyanescens]